MRGVGSIKDCKKLIGRELKSQNVRWDAYPQGTCGSAMGCVNSTDQNAKARSKQIDEQVRLGYLIRG